MIIKRSLDYIIRLSNISCWYYIAAIAIGLILWLKWKKLSVAILTTYCLIIFSVAVLSRKAAYSVNNFIFLRSYRYGITPQILANILVFIPIGMILTRIKWKPLWIGPIYSLFIEFSQLIMHRGRFDVDDIVSNTIGIGVGCTCALIYWLIRNTNSCG